jgi:hypothetical protein
MGKPTQVELERLTEALKYLKKYKIEHNQIIPLTSK